MKKQLLGSICLLISTVGMAQSTNKSYSSPFLDRVSFKVQYEFQGFRIPFSDLSTYAENRGITVGFMYTWKTNGSIQQNLQMGGFFNRHHGSFSHIRTTFQYNPLHRENVTAGIALGAGYMKTGYHKGGWQQGPEGKWFSKSNRQGLLFIPASLQATARVYHNSQFSISPIVSYQLNGLIHYTPDNFIIPQSLISIGTKIKLH